MEAYIVSDATLEKGSFNPKREWTSGKSLGFLCPRQKGRFLVIHVQFPVVYPDK